MTNQIVPYSEIERMGAAVAKSGLFGIKTADQAVALMLIAQAEGLHPAIAARDYHVIQGRPALKADAMLARFLQAGGKVQWDELTDESVTATFAHPSGGTAKIRWTIADAKRIGLAGKDNWRNYPRAMLRSRVVSEGIRTVYPVCVVGVYTPEEVQDFDKKTIDITPPVLPDPPTAPPEGVVIDAQPEPLPQPRPDDLPLDGTLKVYTPGSSEPYALCPSEESWVESVNDLVAKVEKSKSLSDAEKAEKLSGLANANRSVFLSKLPSHWKRKVNLEF
jgi:hypothetical protein